MAAIIGFSSLHRCGRSQAGRPLDCPAQWLGGPVVTDGLAGGWQRWPPVPGRAHRGPRPFATLEIRSSATD